MTGFRGAGARRARLTSPAASWLLNPGSVGQPRDGDPRAAWLELDTESLTGPYHRVDYEIDRSRRTRSGRPGCPTHLGDRLYMGQ